MYFPGESINFFAAQFRMVVGFAYPHAVIIALLDPASAAAYDDLIIHRQDDQIQTTLLLSLIPVVVAFSFVVFIFYRAKREAFFKQKEAELQLSIAEVEMKALRSQINPHFIFNCLNSIHHYMHSNDIKLAGEYLVKFSQLIRYVLETSSSHMVSLEEDLSALKMYMELEQLRLQHSFKFEIDITALPHPKSIYIPPMMLQPFVENSIWHGLNRKGSGGKIHIRVCKENEMIRCVIEDNGASNSTDKNSEPSISIKKTSLGMALIKERLEVVNQIYKMKAGFEKEDRLKDAVPEPGTRIRLSLPMEE